MNVRRTSWWLLLCVALAGCGGAHGPIAAATPSLAATPTVVRPPVDSPSPTPITTPTQEPSSIPVPAASLVCPGQYHAWHPLVVASIYSQAGYQSLDVVDVADTLAPTLVCTVNYAPYPLQRLQWLSPDVFVMIPNDKPSRLVGVDVASQSMFPYRALPENAWLAGLGQNFMPLATMESVAGGTTAVRLSIGGGTQTLTTYPAAGGHGGTIYGFGGPTVEFSPDGKLVMAVDYQANFGDPTVADLQVFDLLGNRVFSSARGTWAVWTTSGLYYDGGDGNVYRWGFGGRPVAVMTNGWIEPDVSPDSRHIAFLSVNPSGAGTFVLQTLDTQSGTPSTLAATDLRIDPLFVTSTMIWVSELVKCDNCYGGNAPTGKVFAYNLTTGAVTEVKLPELLAPMAGASLSPAT